MADDDFKRGDVIKINFSPAIGHEIKDPHPALIIQNDIINKKAAVLIVAAISSEKPSTNKDRRYVFLKKGEAGLSKDSFIHCGQIRTIDKARFISKYGNLSDDRMEEVDEALRISLSL